MKLPAACMLLCILVIGTATAAALNPAELQPGKMVAFPTTQTAMFATKIAPIATTTRDVLILVNIESVPPGADVRIDGAGLPDSKTPLTRALRTGSHTLVISKAGYHDVTMTVTLHDGMPDQHITVNLKQFISPDLVLANESGGRAAGTQAGFKRPVTLTSPNPTPWPDPGLPKLTSRSGVITKATPVIAINCTSSGWTCILLPEAEEKFGIPYAVYGDAPCGYIRNGSLQVPEYCCMGIPKGSVSSGFMRETIASSGPGIHIINKTQLQMMDIRQSGMVKPLGTLVQPSPGLISSVLDFFRGLFHNVACPAGQAICGGKCVDINSNPQNCGTCSNTCTETEACVKGQCVGTGYEFFNPPPIKWDNPPIITHEFGHIFYSLDEYEAYGGVENATERAFNDTPPPSRVVVTDIDHTINDSGSQEVNWTER